MMTTNETYVLSLSSLMKYSLDGVFVLDRSRKCVLFSDACERITGYDKSSVVGAQCRCHDIINCKDDFGRSLSGVLCPSLHVLDGKVPHARQRMEMNHSSGRPIVIETTYSPIRDEQGDITHVLGVMRDLTDMVEIENELHEVSRKLSIDSDHSEFNSVSTEETDADAGNTAYGNGSLDRMLATIEKREILAALRRAKSQRTLAARDLGISRSRLYRRMEALGIDPRKVGSRDEH